MAAKMKLSEGHLLELIAFMLLIIAATQVMALAQVMG